MALSIIHEDLNAAGQVTCFNANKSLFMASDDKYAPVHRFIVLYYCPVNVNAPTAIKWVQNLSPYFVIQDTLGQSLYSTIVKIFFNSTFHCFCCLFVCFWKSRTFINCTFIRKYLPTCFLTVLRNWWFEAWTDRPDPYVWDQPLRRDGHLLQIRRPKLPKWVPAITIRSHDGHICQ